MIADEPLDTVMEARPKYIIAGKSPSTAVESGSNDVVLAIFTLKQS